MEFRITERELQKLNGYQAPQFPKYTSQLMNLANANAQATRPRMVGQLSELFPAYEQEADTITVEEWKAWYLARHPDAMEEAVQKIWKQLENLKSAVALIDQAMVRAWVEDLVIAKTYHGLYVQQAILKRLAALSHESCRMASPEEESKGIDGYVGDTAYSVKPESYKSMGRLAESMDVKMIYYRKTKSGLEVEVESDRAFV